LPNPAWAASSAQRLRTELGHQLQPRPDDVDTDGITDYNGDALDQLGIDDELADNAVLGNIGPSNILSTPLD
jgi:hypothetical protein